MKSKNLLFFSVGFALSAKNSSPPVRMSINPTLIKSPSNKDSISLSKKNPANAAGIIEINILSENQKLRLKSLQEEYNSRINASRDGVTQALYQLESSKVKHLSVKETLEIRKTILTDLEPLVQSGAISRIKYLKEKQEVI